MLEPIRKQLHDGDQAEAWPSLGLIFIDTSVPEEHVEGIIHENLREISGEHSPYVVRPRPEFTLYRGGLDAG